MDASYTAYLQSRTVEELRILALFNDLATVKGIAIQIEVQRRQQADTRMLPVLV